MPANELDDRLERIEDLYEKEDIRRARKELARAKKLFPGDLTLREWEAVFLADDELFEEALKILDGVLAAETDRPFAARERAIVLLELGQFPGAHDQLQTILDRRLIDGGPEEEAEVRFDLAGCLDRLGRSKEADVQFKKAARLAPEDFPVPPRMSESEFDALVGRALDSIPASFQPYLRQVAVTVLDYPPKDAPGPFILGLYSGLPRTERSHGDRDHLDTVFVFKRNHELLGLSPEELREEVRKTVVHEIAHHFGLGEDDMGEYA